MTKEEFNSLDKYQQRHIKLLSLMREDDDLKQYKVISFFKPITRGTPLVTGKVKIVPVTQFTKHVDSSWAVKHLTKKLYTTKGQLRKKYVDMPDWMQYDVGALMLYLNQCYKERCGKALLSYKEYKFLLEK